MNNKYKRRIAASAFAVLAIAFSVLGFCNVLKQNASSNKYAEWMKNLDDNTSLRNVNMPGSHDSAALYSMGDLAGQCQSLSIKDQLNLGVRFLDIRLKEENNKLKAVHSFVDQRQSFDDICKVVESFISNHPSEFIIMSIKEEANSSNSTISFEESLKTYLTSEIYLKTTNIPEKVSLVRGKVILLSRYGGSTIGIPAFNGWSDSTTFTLGNGIFVQDKYKITSAKEKEDAIIQCFNESGHELKINFLSAYRTNYIPPLYAPSAALDINPWINKEISKYDDRGIVLYDFVNEENMNKFFEGVL